MFVTAKIVKSNEMIFLMLLPFSWFGALSNRIRKMAMTKLQPVELDR